jgi:cell division protease FtsH
MPKATPLHKVTIIPRGNALGAAFYFPERDEMSITQQQILTKIAIAYGGRIAEDLFFGDVTTGAANDIQQATSLARRMVMQWGMSEKMGLLNFETGEDRMFLGGEIKRSTEHSPDTARQIDEEVKRITKECYEQAYTIISENKDTMIRIAEKLLVYETLSGEEVKTLMEGGDLERDPPVNPVIKSPEEQAKLNKAEAEKAALAEAEKETKAESSESEEEASVDTTA